MGAKATGQPDCFPGWPLGCAECSFPIGTPRCPPLSTNEDFLAQYWVKTRLTMVVERVLVPAFLNLPECRQPGGFWIGLTVCLRSLNAWQGDEA